MKIKRFIALCLLLAAAVCCTQGLCEGSLSVSLAPGDEWSWARGSYNTFTGVIDLSAFTGQEVIVSMGTEMAYDPDKESKSVPVFTSLNGNRITMMKQSPSVRLTVDADSAVTTFTGALRLPEKGRVSTVPLTIRVQDSEGVILSESAGKIEEVRDPAQKSAFYIPFDINRITMYSAIAAGAVWVLAAALIIVNRENKKHYRSQETQAASGTAGEQ